MIEYSLQCAGFALPVLLSGWITVILSNGFRKGPLDLKNSGPVTRVGLLLTLGGVAGVVIAILGLMASGLVWLWVEFTRDLTPALLALYSLLLGLFPLLLSLLGLLLAKMVGGVVDASGTRDCKFKGVELGGLIYSLFMSYFLFFITGGLAFFGLIISGVWALT